MDRPEPSGSAGSEPAKGPGAGSLYALLLVAVVAAILSGRLFHVLNKYAVNMFFWDEWDFRTPQFQGASLWRIFTWQHGPPRLGIGFVVDTLVNRLTRWDSRGTAFLEGAVMVAAMLSALWLKRRLFGDFAASDVVIPVIVLTLGPCLAFTTTPIVAHGPFPLFLTMLFCLAWTIRNLYWRYGLVLLVNFLLIYTGFGTFVGFITPVLFAVEIFHGRRERGWLAPAAALAISLLSLGAFFIGYQVAPAAGCLVFSWMPLLHYLWFAGLVFSTVFFLGGHSLFPSLVGLAALLLALLICGWCVYQFLRRRGDPAYQIVGITITGSSLLFAINAAVGRLCHGIEGAHAARYIPYVMPAFIGIYFSLLSLRGLWTRRALVAIFTVVVLAGAVPFSRQERRGLVSMHGLKTAWKVCYLQTGSIDYCNSHTRFQIYPVPAATHLEQKLEFLKAHRLNLFNGD